MNLSAAVEHGTYVVALSFTDENGTSMVPNTVTWTLRDESGAVVNGREDVVETPAASIDLLLYGDDLAYAVTSRRRILTVSCTYDSDLGDDLPLSAEWVIPIRNLVGIGS